MHSGGPPCFRREPKTKTLGAKTNAAGPPLGGGKGDPPPEGAAAAGAGAWCAWGWMAREGGGGHKRTCEFFLPRAFGAVEGFYEESAVSPPNHTDIRGMCVARSANDIV